MSCSELGISDEGLRISKSCDTEIIGDGPSSLDLTDYDAEFVIRATEGSASALLTVNGTPIAGGSVVLCDGALITLRLKQDDILTIPDADPASDPYVGVCELVVVAPSGLRTRVFLLPCIVEKGVAR